MERRRRKERRWIKREIGDGKEGKGWEEGKENKR